ncbi:MAG: phosphoglucosamine mutase, partial [Candidatus Bathyarchaeota archaeon]|nr:phosphoglucosamine mutase [Candidatus Bathyarchaeota archaeon]
LLSALKLMAALETEGKTLSELLSGIPEYPTLRAKVECPDLEKGKAMESVSSAYGGEFGEVEEVSTLDGVRLRLEDGWVLIRPSGTEPIIRITVEARSDSRAKELLAASRRLVKGVLGGER